MKLRFLLAWGNYPKGAIIEPPPNVAGQYLSTVWYGQRIVEEVIEEPTEASHEDREIPPALPAASAPCGSGGDTENAVERVARPRSRHPARRDDVSRHGGTGTGQA